MAVPAPLLPVVEPPGAPFWQRVSLRQVAFGTALVAITLLGVALVVQLRTVVLLLFLGIVLATALMPIADRLRRFGLGRSVATAIAFVLLMLLVGGIVATVVPFFVAQVLAVVDKLPASYAALRVSLTTSAPTWLQTAVKQLPANPFTELSGGAGVPVAVTDRVPTLGTALIDTLLVLLIGYYWLTYRERAVRAVALLVPQPQRAGAVRLWSDIEAKIGAFVRGLAILGLAIGAMAGIGYWLIGLPYAFTIAVIAALLEAIPYIGPFITMVLAVLVGFGVSPTLGLLTLGVAVVIQLVEGNIVVPRVMDRAVGVHPVITLLALGVFADLFGLLGAILAVPLAAAIQLVVDRVALREPLPEQIPLPASRSVADDGVTAVRQQTRDLVAFVQQQVQADAVAASGSGGETVEELTTWLHDLDGILAESQERV